MLPLKKNILPAFSLLESQEDVLTAVSQGTGDIAADGREGKPARGQDILVLQVLISFPVEFLFHLNCPSM